MRSSDVRVILACCGLAPAAALAQTGAQTPAPETWQFAASLFAYVPQLSGTASFPIAGADRTFNLSQSEVIDGLKMTFMGAFDAHHDPWGFFIDARYLDLGRSKSGFRDFTLGDMAIPATASADISADLKIWVATAVGEYRALSGDAGALDLLAGVRYLDAKERLQWNITGTLGDQPPATRAGNNEISNSAVDAIVGVKGQLRGDGPWSMPYYLDLGAGGSHFTWQGAVGLAYGFHWGEISFLFQYLDYRLDSDKLKDLTLAGPVLGATFRW